MAGKKAAAKAAEPKAVESGIYLDPQLAEIRDVEMAKLDGQQVQPRQDATLDPLLAKQRDAEIKAGK